MKQSDATEGSGESQIHPTSSPSSVRTAREKKSHMSITQAFLSVNTITSCPTETRTRAPPV
jgi:hypothetical protein